MATVAEIENAIIRAGDANDLDTVRRLAPQLEAARLEENRAAFMLPRDTSLVEDVTSGFRAGAVGLGEMAALGGATLLEEESEQAARERIQSVFKYLNAKGGDPESLGYKFGSGLGSVAGIISAALAAKAGAGILGAGAGLASLLGTGVAGTLGIGAGAGEASERARAAGVSEEVRADAARKGAAIGVTEILPLGRILKIPGVGPALDSLAGKIGSDAVEGFVKRARSAVATGSVEGLQESGAGILQNLVEQGYNPQKALIDAGIIEEGGVGFGVGTLIQALTDLVVKGKTRTSDPFAASDQGELFPDTDLGTQPSAPPVTTGGQQELFPDVDLGRAPEQPDGQQLDLFDPPTTRAGKLRDRIRFLELEKEREQQAGMAADDPYSLEIDAEISKLNDELAASKPKEAPAQGELPLGTEVGPPQADRAAQQREDTAERERLGLVAAGRGDVEGFEQPDLFPVEAESARAVSEETDALRRIGGASSPVSPTPAPVTAEGQIDLEDAIYNRQIDDAEFAEIEAMLNADQELKDLSTLESADARRTTLQQQQTDKVRGDILGSVLSNLDTASRDAVVKRFSQALGDAGITNTSPTMQERATIRRATDVVKASKEAPLQYELDLPSPEEVSDVGTIAELEPAGGRVSVPDDTQVLDVTEQVPPEGTDTPGVTPPSATGLGTAGVSPGRAIRGAGAEQFTLDLSPREAFRLSQPIEETLAREADIAAEAAPQPEVEAEQPRRRRKRVLPGTEPGKQRQAKLKGRKTRAERLEELKQVTPTYMPPEGGAWPEANIDQYASAYKRILNEELPESAKEVLRTQGTFSDEMPAFTAKDIEAIKTVLSVKPAQRDNPGKSVVAYMLQKEPGFSFEDGLQDAIYDVVHNEPQYRTPPGLKPEDAEAAKKYVGTGGKKAREAIKWIKEKLSPTVNAYIEAKTAEMIRNAQKEQMRNGNSIDDINQLNKKLEKLARARAAQQARDDLQSRVDELAAELAADLPLDTNAVLASAVPISPKVARALREGRLDLALAYLGVSSPNGTISNAANKLRSVVGDTKVEVVENLKDEMGVPRAGVFDPKTNTIKLSASEGMNAHVLLHEMAHAATSATIANKNHPMTKQLIKLFEDVKPMLDSAYGATNVDEFVSEAMSNPEFQQKLAGINPGGTEITAWQRFTNSVGNFLRKMFGMKPKAINSALTQTDLFIDAILSPAPAFRDSADLPMNSTRAGVKAIAQEIGRTAKDFRQNTPAMREKFGDAAAQFLNKGVGNSVKDWYLRTLGSQSLGDVAKKLGFGDTLSYAYDKLANDQRGSLEKSDKFVNERVIEANKWYKNATPEQVQAFKNVIYSREYGATVTQVDPTLTRDAAKDKYEGQTDSSGNDLWAIWQRQHQEWNKIGPGGQRIYKLMRNTYDTLYARLEKVITGRIDALDLPKESKVKLSKNVYDRLFAKKALSVYFPLIREGNYKLTYSIKPEAVADGQDSFVVERFENYRERDRAAEALKKDPNIISASVKAADGDLTTKNGFDKAPPMSFVSQTLQTLEAAGVDTDTREQIVNLFLNVLPENSFAKSLQGRGGKDNRGIAGHLDDPFLALQTKGFDIARQTVRMEYTARLDALEKDLIEKAKSLEEKGAPAPRTAAGRAVGEIPTNLVRDELIERIRFARSGARNKQIEKYVRNANQLAFVYTIGLNAASSLVNLSQVPLFVLPMLGGRYGERAAARELMRAAKLVTGASIGSKSDSRLGKILNKASLAYGIDAYYDVNSDGDFIVRKDLKLDKGRVAELERLAPLVQLASQRGQLTRTYMTDALGLEEGGRARTGSAYTRNMDRITAISAGMFSQAERFNRQTTMVAAYNLALNDITDGKPGTATTAQREAAAERALYHTQEYNGGSVLETAPRISQQSIGRVAMMYKTYGLQMYYTMMKTAKEMVDFHFAGNKKERNRAFKQLLGIHGSAIFFAGAYGVPLYGAVQLMADALFLDDDEDDFNTIVRKELGEGWFKGPLQDMLGINIADRVRLSGLLIQENRYNPNASVEEDIMYYLGGPALSIGKRFLRGMDDLQEGNVMRGIESLLPPAIANGLKVTIGRYQQDGGIYTRRNDPIYSDMSTWEMMAQGIGFMPAEFIFRQEQNQRDKRVEGSIVKQRSNLMRKYYIAQRTGDLEELIEVMGKMSDFGIKHPDAAISTDDLNKSIKRHEKTSSEMYNGVTINPLVRRAIELSRMEYSQ